MVCEENLNCYDLFLFFFGLGFHLVWVFFCSVLLLACVVWSVVWKIQKECDA